MAQSWVSTSTSIIVIIIITTIIIIIIIIINIYIAPNHACSRRCTIRQNELY